MLWCNVLRRAGLNYCVNDTSPGTFVEFSQVVLEWYFREKYHNSDRYRFHLVPVLPLVLNKK